MTQPVKESACNAADLGSIPGLGKSLGGTGYPLQYSGLENSRECIVHGVPISQTQLSDFHFHVFTFQWLGLWAFTAGGKGLIPGRGTNIL